MSARDIDEALERVQRLREQLLTDVEAPDRAGRLALVFEFEARLWSQLFDLSAQRLIWRAALAAEALARQHARIWRQCAVGEMAERRTPTPVPAASEAEMGGGCDVAA